MRYTAKYFRNGLPEWKRKKDPILHRIFYRRLSFYWAAVAANLGINANSVSYFSTIVGIMGSLCFFTQIHYMYVVGAVLINVWLVLDCTDGNLARCVRRQPFGEFADGISSYVLVALMCTAMGASVYHTGGLFIPKGWMWVVVLGAFASTSDTLMRLIYQKYKNNERDMVDMGIIEIEKEARTDHGQVRSFRVRVEAELGIGGLLPFFILLASMFGVLDLVVIYCFFYYGGSCVVMSILYIRKAMMHANKHEAMGM